jgi:hypothetical protein
MTAMTTPTHAPPDVHSLLRRQRDWIKALLILNLVTFVFALAGAVFSGYVAFVVYRALDALQKVVDQFGQIGG